MAYIIDNNVLTTLHTAIVPATTSIIIDVPSAPNKVAVAPAAGNIATLTIVDQIVSPTVLEIITYTTATSNGDGTYTLTGVTRGTEGTTAQTFSVGALCFQAITAATFNAVASQGINTLLQFVGDGSDGSFTNNAARTLTTDTWFRNLTMGPTGSYNTNGYALYVAGVLDLTSAVAGAIHGPDGVAGAAASGAVGGAAGTGAPGVTVPGGSAGSAGGAVPNGNSSNAPAPLSAIGGAGGGGGGPNVGTGAPGNPANYGGAGILFSDERRPGRPFLVSNSGTVTFSAAGLGGSGGGGGSNANCAGGGGGGGGGACVVYAGTIATSATTPAGVIRSGTGGAGGAGGTGTGGGGAGGGGGGGPCIVGYGARTGPAVANGIKSTGGAAGVQTGSSATGNAGASGPLHVYNLLLGSGTYVQSVIGNNGSGAAGGVSNATL